MKRTATSYFKAVSFLLLFIPAFLSAQDIHFSQFYHAPLTLNPALTAADTMDYRLTANYRGQWYSALVPYLTFGAVYEQKFKIGTDGKQSFGLGLTFSYDAAGDAKLSLAQFSAHGSYIYKLDAENFVSGGLQIGLAQRSFDPQTLTFDNQFNGDIFDPGRPTNESFTKTNNFFADFGIGLNYHGQKIDRRSKFDAGVGLFHVNRPDQSYLPGDKAPLPMRWSLYLMPDIQLTDIWDLTLAGTAQLQSTYFEALAGAGVRFHLNRQRSQELAVQLGAGYRFNSFGDAVIPTIVIYYQGWTFGISYDVNISGFQAATNRNGGPEVAVRYAINRVDPVPYKLCRLF
ncbi:MAG: PorP/SprF family type IX secretion system membrane protein [Phaeodactylibacter sp.]|nr:PorP/SprF family type IX secretion system membrane protein [Phaeodactylibacter sp.]